MLFNPPSPRPNRSLLPPLPHQPLHRLLRTQTVPSRSSADLPLFQLGRWRHPIAPRAPLSRALLPPVTSQLIRVMSRLHPQVKGGTNRLNDTLYISSLRCIYHNWPSSILCLTRIIPWSSNAVVISSRFIEEGILNVLIVCNIFNRNLIESISPWSLPR